MKKPVICIAADHRGFKLKTILIEDLRTQGFEVDDLGTTSEERCDASDFAKSLAHKISSHVGRYGILICGTGHAMAITANRYKNIRAVQCVMPAMARAGREHNDANVVVLGADLIDADMARTCVDIFLKTNFLGGRYAERRDKLTALGGLLE